MSNGVHGWWTSTHPGVPIAKGWDTLQNRYVMCISTGNRPFARDTESEIHVPFASALIEGLYRCIKTFKGTLCFKKAPRPIHFPRWSYNHCQVHEDQNSPSLETMQVETHMGETRWSCSPLAQCRGKSVLWPALATHVCLTVSATQSLDDSPLMQSLKTCLLMHKHPMCRFLCQKAIHDNVIKPSNSEPFQKFPLLHLEVSQEWPVKIAEAFLLFFSLRRRWVKTVGARLAFCFAKRW